MPARPHRLLSVLAGWLLLAAGQTQPLVVTSPRPQVEGVLPGEVVTLVVAVENHSRDALEASLEASLPDGWRLFLPPPTLILAPGESRNAILPLLLPAGTRAGTHVVRIGVAGDGSAEPARIEVKVDPVRSVKARVENAPESVLPEAYRIVYRVTNEGNLEERVRLAVSSNLDLALRPDPTELLLASGESARVTVTVPPVEGLERSTRHTVTLTASPAGGQAAWAVARTELVAMAQPERLAYHTFPLELSIDLGAVLGRAGRPPQLSLYDLELTGRGPLQEGGDTELGFRVRYGSTIGRRHVELSLRRGEQQLFLGGLRQGLGTLLPTAAGYGVAIKTFDSGQPVSMYGLATADGPRAGFAVGPVELADSAFTFRGAFGRDLAVVSTRGRFEDTLPEGARLALEVEPALDILTGAPALQAALKLTGSGYSIDSAYVRQLSGYRGENGSRTEFGVSARASLTTGLTAVAKLDSHARPRYTQNRIGVGLEGSSRESRWGVSYQIDRHTQNDVHVFLSSLAVGGALLPVDGRALSATLTWGSRRMSSGVAPRDLLFLETAGTLPVSGGSLLGSLKTEYDIAAGKFTDIRIGSAWRENLSPSTVGEIAVELDVVGNPRTELEIEVTHDLLTGASFEASLEALATAAGQGRVVAGVGLVLPMELRLGRLAGVSGVRGYIRDADGRAVPGLVVAMAGFTTVTGSDGSFGFPAIPQGDHLLFLRGLDPSWITVPAIPFVVSVPAEEPLEIVVAPAASIRGQLHVVAPEAGATTTGVVEGGATTALPSAGNIRLVLVGDGVERWTYADAEGRFEFGRLPPGTWNLSLDPSTLPSGYEAGTGAVEIELAPGNARRVDFELRPIRREIRFTGGGDLSCFGALPGRGSCGPGDDPGPAKFE